jgi:hypothetical protein
MLVAPRPLNSSTGQEAHASSSLRLPAPGPSCHTFSPSRRASAAYLTHSPAHILSLLSTLSTTTAVIILATIFTTSHAEFSMPPP